MKKLTFEKVFSFFSMGGYFLDKQFLNATIFLHLSLLRSKANYSSTVKGSIDFFPRSLEDKEIG